MQYELTVRASDFYVCDVERDFVMPAAIRVIVNPPAPLYSQDSHMTHSCAQYYDICLGIVGMLSSRPRLCSGIPKESYMQVAHVSAQLSSGRHQS